MTANTFKSIYSTHIKLCFKATCLNWFLPSCKCFYLEGAGSRAGAPSCQKEAIGVVQASH